MFKANAFGVLQQMVDVEMGQDYTYRTNLMNRTK